VRHYFYLIWINCALWTTSQIGRSYWSGKTGLNEKCDFRFLPVIMTYVRNGLWGLLVTFHAAGIRSLCMNVFGLMNYGTSFVWTFEIVLKWMQHILKQFLDGYILEQKGQWSKKWLNCMHIWSRTRPFGLQHIAHLLREVKSEIALFIQNFNFSKTILIIL
jgi:hypothetical protein